MFSSCIGYLFAEYEQVSTRGLSPANGFSTKNISVEFCSGYYTPRELLAKTCDIRASSEEIPTSDVARAITTEKNVLHRAVRRQNRKMSPCATVCKDCATASGDNLCM